MSLRKKNARALLVVGIVLVAVGLGLFVIVPLVAWAPLVAGVVLVVVSSSAWAGKPARPAPHHHEHRKGH